MSGGRFDYNENFIMDIIQSIKQDIEHNNVTWKEAEDKKLDHYGYQLSEDIIKLMNETTKQLEHIYKVLHQYDLLVSGDICEKDFRKELEIDNISLAQKAGILDKNNKLTDTYKNQKDRKVSRADSSIYLDKKLSKQVD